MMKKRKIALALGLCTVVGLSAVGLAACGEKPPKEGAKSEYYIVGFSASDIFGGELDWGKQHKETVAEIPDAVNFKTTKTSNVYELTVDLYENDEFQIVIAGKGWTGQMGYEVLAKDHPANGVVEIPGGGTNSNFKLDRDGRYTFTLTVNGEGASTVTYTRTDEQAKLPRISLNKTALVLTAGGEETLTATLKDTSTAVVWSSDKPDVATVDAATGKVTAVAAGSAVITAKSGDATATCKVTVAKAAVNYYLIGSSPLDYFSWTPATDLSAINENILLEAGTTDGTYSLTTNLYAGTQFKIFMFGSDWDTASGYGNLDTATKAESFVADDSGNIKITQDGSYQITLSETQIPAEGETPASVKREVKIERKGDAPALAWSYDVYAKGSWDWDHILSDYKLNTTALDKDNLTCTKNLTFTANQEFMFLTSKTTGDPAQVSYANAKSAGVSVDTAIAAKFDLTGNNIKCVEAGSYSITVTLNASGDFASIVIGAAA